MRRGGEREREQSLSFSSLLFSLSFLYCCEGICSSFLSLSLSFYASFFLSPWVFQSLGGWELLGGESRLGGSVRGDITALVGEGSVFMRVVWDEWGWCTFKGSAVSSSFFLFGGRRGRMQLAWPPVLCACRVVLGGCVQWREGGFLSFLLHWPRAIFLSGSLPPISLCLSLPFACSFAVAPVSRFLLLRKEEKGVG